MLRSQETGLRSNGQECKSEVGGARKAVRFIPGVREGPGKDNQSVSLPTQCGAQMSRHFGVTLTPPVSTY